MSQEKVIYAPYDEDNKFRDIALLLAQPNNKGMSSLSVVPAESKKIDANFCINIAIGIVMTGFVIALASFILYLVLLSGVVTGGASIIGPLIFSTMVGMPAGLSLSFCVGSCFSDSRDKQTYSSMQGSQQREKQSAQLSQKIENPSGKSTEQPDLERPNSYSRG